MWTSFGTMSRLLNTIRHGNWAAGVVQQYHHLGMPSPFSFSGIVTLNSLGFPAKPEGRLRKVWDGLHVCPRTAPSKGVKLCTYFAWVFRPSQLRFDPYSEITMPISKLRLLMQFRMGSHALPSGTGRFARPGTSPSSAPVHIATPGRWVMSGILSLTAAILLTFAGSFVCCIVMLMVPCSHLSGIKTRRPCVIAKLPFFLIWQMTLAWTCPYKPVLAEWTS